MFPVMVFCTSRSAYVCYQKLHDYIVRQGQKCSFDPWTVKTFPCTMLAHFIESVYFCSCAILQTSIQLSLLLVFKNINEMYE